MRDRVCPIGDCTATVTFDQSVAEVTPRYRLHDLSEVDEFAECPSCEAEVAGFYAEDASGECGDGVELILDIDDDGEASGDANADATGADADASAVGDGDFEDPDDVLGETASGDDGDGDDDGGDDHDPVFG